MKVFPFLLLITVFFVLSFQSTKKDDKIYWTSERKLTWEDFRGRAPKVSQNGAISSVGISYEFVSYKKPEMKIQVHSVFYPSTSWVQMDDKILSTLEHEQLHFDIVELHTRKFRKLIKEQEKFRERSMEEKIRSYYDKIKKELDVCQDLYDKETTRPRNEVKQAEWEEKIKKQLQELEKFTDTLIVIPLK